MNPSPAFVQALAQERAAEAVRLRVASTPDQTREAIDRLADLAELEARALDVPSPLGREGAGS